MNELLITFTPDFKRDYKRLFKKYVSLNEDMKELVEKLKENPILGTPLGNSAFKIRLAISSKNKGKSGGARIITYFLSQENELYLLSIYDKSDQVNISDKSITGLIENILEGK